NLFLLLTHHGQGLDHAQPVSFSVYERHETAHSRDVHRLAEHFSAGLLDHLHLLVDVVDGDHDGGVCLGHIPRFLVKAAIYHSELLRAVLVGLRGHHDDVVTHLGTQLIRFPPKRLRIEFYHALSVAGRQLEMHHWVHFHIFTSISDILQNIKCFS